MAAASPFTLRGLVDWARRAADVNASPNANAADDTADDDEEDENDDDAKDGIDRDLRRLRHVADAFADVYDAAELRALKRLAPAGVYVTPRLGDGLRQWDGVVFVSVGVYAGGVFRFCVELDEAGPPRLRFVHAPFHPLVAVADGAMQLHRRFPVWEPAVNQLWEVVEFVKTALIRPQADDDGSGCANDEAAFLLLHRPEQFNDRARQSAQRSIVASQQMLPTPFHQGRSTEALLEDDVFHFVNVSNETQRAIEQYIAKFNEKIQQTSDESDVDLWIEDFLENMQEAVELTVPPLRPRTTTHQLV